MWKKQDDTQGPQGERVFAANQQPDFAPIGDTMREPSTHDDWQREIPAGALPSSLTQDSASSSPTMKSYTDAVKEFTTSTAAFIEHLPLLRKARQAYEEAMKASTEMRKVLDAGDEDMRTLMTHLEERINLQDLRPPAEKKSPEPAKVERMKEADEGGGRVYKWP